MAWAQRTREVEVHTCNPLTHISSLNVDGDQD